MIERSDSLHDWLATEPDDIPGEDEPELYSTYLTFEAIFGKIDKNLDGATVAKGQMDVARKLQIALEDTTSTTPPLIEFRCNSDWLKHKEGTEYKDTRPDDRGGGIIRDMGKLGVCRPADAEQQLAAFRSGHKSDIDRRVEVITFCPEANKKYTEMSLREHRDRTCRSRGYHLDTLKAESMVFTLIHELSHSSTILKDSQK
ncbi:hypothetical protein BJX70DRAFT_396306 [Aspergillus crustosus]